MRRFLAVSMAALSVAALVVTGGPARGATPPAVVAVHNTGMASWGDNIALDGGRLAYYGVEADQGRDLNGDGDTSDYVAHVWDPATGQSTNLGLAAGILQPAAGGRLAFPVPEYAQGNTDLNGDGDTEYGDSTHYVWDPATGRATSLGVGSAYDAVTLSGGELAMMVRESDDGNTDLNGDSDASDFVVHVWAPATGVVNLRIAADVDSLQPLDSGRLAFLASESGQNHTDFNGDGTAGDQVLQVWDPVTGAVQNSGLANSTSDTFPLGGGAVGVMVPEDSQGKKDRNGDGDILDKVAAVWDPRTGTATNLGLASEPSIALEGSAGNGRMLVPVQESDQGDRDLNGDGDTLDRVVHIWDPAAGTKNLRLAAPRPNLSPEPLGDGSVAFRVKEEDQAGTDLNGDGDAKDLVVHVWDPGNGVRNLGLASGGDFLSLGDGTLVDRVIEADQRVDLNGDGDKGDGVMYAWTRAGGVTNIGLSAMNWSVLDADRVALSVWESFEGARDLNGDGDANDELLYLWDRPTGSTVALGYASSVNMPDALGSGRLGFMVQEGMQGRDLNGDGDQSDHVVHVATLSGTAPPPGSTTPGSGDPGPGSGAGSGGPGGGTTSGGPGGGTTGSDPSSGPMPGSPGSPVGQDRSGYWLVAGDGTVFAFGAAAHHGNAGPRSVDLESTPTGGGYWVVDSFGTVTAFGDAIQITVPRPRLAAGESVTSISATPTGRGFWLFTSLGRVITAGDAPALGDMSAVRLNGAIVDSIATPSGRGYYMVAADGGIFAFGDARFHGSMGGRPLNAPVRSLVPDPDGTGYWLVASDGGVFAFDAGFRGSMGGTRLNRPVTGMVPYGNGYLMVGEDGGVFNFSNRPFSGSLGGRPPAHPIVSVAALR